jgi:hypothetical protein
LHVIEQEWLLLVIAAESLVRIGCNHRVLMTGLLRVLGILVFLLIMISRFVCLLHLLSLHLPLLSFPHIIIISDDTHETLEHRLLLAGAQLIRLFLEFNLYPKL